MSAGAAAPTQGVFLGCNQMRAPRALRCGEARCFACCAERCRAGSARGAATGVLRGSAVSVLHTQEAFGSGDLSLAPVVFADQTVFSRTS